ncbi:zinc finger MYM-type protein 1-like [Ciona intestinalis]
MGVDGWRDFKKGRQCILKHTNSKAHINASSSLKIVIEESSTAALVNTNLDETYKNNRLALTAIFDAVRHQGVTGQALRGHGDEKETGNLWSLLYLLGKYNSTIQDYFLKCSTSKFMSPDVQNEIVSMLGHAVLRQLLKTIKIESKSLCSFVLYSVIIDETSDISRSSQVSFCIRYCDKDLQSNEVFTGFYESSNCDSATLFQLVNNVLIRYGLKCHKFVGKDTMVVRIWREKLKGYRTEYLA